MLLFDFIYRKNVVSVVLSEASKECLRRIPIILAAIWFRKVSIFKTCTLPSNISMPCRKVPYNVMKIRLEETICGLIGFLMEDEYRVSCAIRSTREFLTRSLIPIILIAFLV